MPVSSEFFLPLMRGDFLAFSFFSAGHVGTPYRLSGRIMHVIGNQVKGRKNSLICDAIEASDPGYTGTTEGIEARYVS
ncbi:MAG TPA: hypothetical protein PKH81_01685, partial [Treponemataceae bacterium]|nr:hypothetical protein [Treponemataceae bacterium]